MFVPVPMIRTRKPKNHASPPRHAIHHNRLAATLVPVLLSATLAGGATCALDATINVVYALEDSAVTIDASDTLASDEALRIDGAGRTLTVQSGRVALAKISSRSAP